MYSFPKNEHLCGDKNIQLLLTEGKSFLVYPFRVVYLPVKDEEVDVRVLITVSKKRFKRAVKRNRIKRLTREVYRLNKNELFTFVNAQQKQLYVAFQYVSSEIDTFENLNEKMKLALGKIIQNLGKTDESNQTNS